MKSKMLLISHGHFASGIKSSLEMITGKQDWIDVCDAYTTEAFDLENWSKAYLEKHAFEGRLVVVTDVFGGSVNNAFTLLQHHYSFELVTGMNLALLLELVANKEHLTEDVIRNLVDGSKDFIQYIEKQDIEIEEDDF